MSDSGAIDFRSNHNPPTTGEPAMMPCLNEDGAPMEPGTGGAAEGNAQMGTQQGGAWNPGDGTPKLAGW